MSTQHDDDTTRYNGRMKRYIPNLLTLLNLTVGNLGLYLVVHNNLLGASCCIWVGSLCDFLDGWLARTLKASSPLGQQLDVLADLTTFGGLPASILHVLLCAQTTPDSYLPYVTLLIPNCTALRLARFNTTKQAIHLFVGLPTPANGLLISTLPWMLLSSQPNGWTTILAQPYTLTTIILCTSYLLIAGIPFMTLKFTDYAWYPNRYKYAFLLLSTILVCLLQIQGLALSIAGYIGTSVGIHLVNKMLYIIK